MVEINGSLVSGSGTIVRQAVVFAALTGRPLHLFNARLRRLKPGLRPQHVRVVEAIAELVGGRTEGVAPASQEFRFWPGAARGVQHAVWDIGSAGSTVLLALAALPVMALRGTPGSVELRGGIFQDFAPSVYHLQHVMLPLLRRMGFDAEVEMARPGYVPKGGGLLRLTLGPLRQRLQALVCDQPAALERLWGIAISSHLQQRQVSERMAKAAQEVFTDAGHRADLEIVNDTTALQPGAGFAVFADLAGSLRLGAGGCGARRRPAEAIGKQAAHELLEDLGRAATLDRHASDQVIPFAALAAGESRFRIPHLSEHIQRNAWLAKHFLGAEVTTRGQVLSIRGVGFAVHS